MLSEALEKYGLSKKEAKVYLALLELGKAKVQEVAAKTKLPRSTIYAELEFLEKKGLIFSFEQRKLKYFSPQDPRKILRQAQEQAGAIKDIFPDLKTLYQGTQLKPQIKYHQGKEEIEAMYNNILKERGLIQYDIIASEEAWLKMDPLFFEDFKKRRARAGIKTRLILEYSKIAQERQAKEKETLSEVKIIPPAFPFKPTAGCYIFKEKVIFLAYKKEHIAIEIVSFEIASLLKMIFEFMWRFLGK